MFSSLQSRSLFFVLFWFCFVAPEVRYRFLAIIRRRVELRVCMWACAVRLKRKWRKRTKETGTPVLCSATYGFGLEITTIVDDLKRMKSSLAQGDFVGEQLG